MRVTHIISNLELGGAEGALCTLIEAQAGTGVEHTVISMMAGGVYAPRLRAAGATVIEMPGTRSIAFARKLGALGQAVGGSRPDLVQGWMYHANVAASTLRLARYFRAPVIWGVRQSISRLSDDVPLTRCVILGGTVLSFEPRAIIYNSEQGAATHERLGYPVAKRVIIHNGVDCERFRPRPAARGQLLEALGLPAGTRLIGRIARFAPMKDHGTMLAAFSRVRARNPQAHLILVGTGMTKDNAALMALWQSNGAPEGVHFAGPRADVENVYAGLDVAVSSSSSNEGFANTVFEALACGTPVIATNVGTGEEFRACAAVVVEPRQPEDMAHAIDEALAMEAARRSSVSERGRLAVAERHGTRSYAARFHALWAKTLKQAGAGVAQALR